MGLCCTERQGFDDPMIAGPCSDDPSNNFWEIFAAVDRRRSAGPASVGVLGSDVVVRTTPHGRGNPLRRHCATLDGGDEPQNPGQVGERHQGCCRCESVDFLAVFLAVLLAVFLAVDGGRGCLGGLEGTVMLVVAHGHVLQCGDYSSHGCPAGSLGGATSKEHDCCAASRSKVHANATRRLDRQGEVCGYIHKREWSVETVVLLASYMR